MFSHIIKEVQNLISSYRENPQQTVTFQKNIRESGLRASYVAADYRRSGKCRNFFYSPYRTKNVLSLMLMYLQNTL